MARHGDHSLGETHTHQGHYDSATLAAYALDQLPAAQNQEIGQHLAECAICRIVVAAEQDLAHSIADELHRTLGTSFPGPGMSFGPIAQVWRKTPRRVMLAHRLERLLSGFALVPLALLLVLAAVTLAPSRDTRALRALNVTRDYSGPPTLVALALEDGIAIVRLAPERSQIVRTVRHVRDVSSLDFAPDGRWLAFRRGGMLNVVEIVTGGAHFKLPVRAAGKWAWSPDGGVLAYTDGGGQLLTFAPQSQMHSVLVPASEGAWGNPVWSTDGRQIAYAVGAAGRLGSALDVGTQAIWRVERATGYRVEIVHNPAPQIRLLVPTAWPKSGTLLATWDALTGAPGSRTVFYRIDLLQRPAAPLAVDSLAREDRRAWLVSTKNAPPALSTNRLSALPLPVELAGAVSIHFPAPITVNWAPGTARLATVVPGQAAGEGLFVYAVDAEQIVSVPLPGETPVEAAYWAGPEHLSVIRRPDGAAHAELWLAPANGDETPLRLVTNLPLPHTASWTWRDVLAARVIDGTVAPLSR